MILSTPLTGFLFIIDEDGYRYGFGYPVVFIFGIIALLSASIEIIRNWKHIRKSQALNVILFSVASCCTIALQIRHPEYQLTGLACTITVFSAFLSLSSPGHFFDSSTGTLNKLAFKDTLISPKFETNSSAIILKLTKTNKLKDTFGIEGRYYITRQFMKRISIICNTKNVFYLFNDTYIILLDKANAAETYGREIQKLTSSAIQIFPSTTSTATINYLLSARINVINNIETLLYGQNEDITYSLDEIISLINYIATTNKDKTLTIVTKEIVSDFKETLRRQRVVEKAIKNESFEVFLQPIYSVTQNTYIGAEALLRLKDDNGEYIPPASFIPEAEANGDILKISDIMLQKTCDFINETKLFDKGIQTVNINLSVVQCMSDGIIDHICEIFERNHISPTLIRFEITESVAVNDEARFSKLLEEMTKRGFEYALDDYGTGYSNTSKILTHNFAEIKFDKSLIDSMSENDENEKAMKYLFDLTKEKRMISLAEGVETKEAVDMLKKLGCNMIQGFYYARPMPPAEFSKFLDEHNN